MCTPLAQIKMFPPPPPVSFFLVSFILSIIFFAVFYLLPLLYVYNRISDPGSLKQAAFSPTHC